MQVGHCYRTLVIGSDSDVQCYRRAENEVCSLYANAPVMLNDLPWGHAAWRKLLLSTRHSKASAGRVLCKEAWPHSDS